MAPGLDKDHEEKVQGESCTCTRSPGLLYGAQLFIIWFHWIKDNETCKSWLRQWSKIADTIHLSEISECWYRRPKLRISKTRLSWIRPMAAPFAKSLQIGAIRRTRDSLSFPPKPWTSDRRRCSPPRPASSSAIATTSTSTSASGGAHTASHSALPQTTKKPAISSARCESQRRLQEDGLDGDQREKWVGMYSPWPWWMDGWSVDRSAASASCFSESRSRPVELHDYLGGPGSGRGARDVSFGRVFVRPTFS